MGWPIPQWVSAGFLCRRSRVRSPHGAKNLWPRYETLQVTEGSLRVLRLPPSLQIIQDAANLILKIQNLFSFQFPNSNLPAFTPHMCTVYCCPCCVSVICLSSQVKSTNLYYHYYMEFMNTKKSGANKRRLNKEKKILLFLYFLYMYVQRHTFATHNHSHTISHPRTVYLPNLKQTKNTYTSRAFTAFT